MFNKNLDERISRVVWTETLQQAQDIAEQLHGEFDEDHFHETGLFEEFLHLDNPLTPSSLNSFHLC
jgi:hypothetical protein